MLSKHAAIVFFTALSAASAAQASIDYLTPGAAVAQNFDSLATTGTGSWTNSATLPGLYMYYSTAFNAGSGRVTGGIDSPTGSWTAPSQYLTSPTANTGSRMWSYGASGSSDRALGTLAGSTETVNPGDWFYALVLRNNTGATLTEFTLSYTGEQWRQAGINTSGSLSGLPSPAQKLGFSYLVAPTFTPDTDIPTSGGLGSYTAASALDFVTPTVGNTGSASVLDGNAAANRTLISSTITADWAAGDYLILRWWDDDDNGNEHGLAIDDLTFSAQATLAPEPASLALIATPVTLLATRRRRRI